MRKIKFRRYKVRLKKMAYEQELKRELGMYWLDNAIGYSEPMQFAQNWDTEHREIYQGDILEGHDGFRYRVIYNGIKFYLSAWDTTDRKVDSWVLDMFDLSLLRIIGNIYENPELLGKV